MSNVPCGECGQPVPYCPVCERGKFHDPQMHWAPDSKFAACGKPVGARYPERPHYVINRNSVIDITCPNCKYS